LRLSELSCIGEDKQFREKTVPAKRQFSNDRLACVGGCALNYISGFVLFIIKAIGKL
jgi:hypothetical protein